MSGFTRDTKHYGDRLVYEALHTKWNRYHDRCRCGEDWVSAHAEPAGFTVVSSGSGFVALIGPGLTEGVDESALTTSVLWEAVTGEPGAQDWFETVHIIDRSHAAETARKASNESVYQERRERSEAARKEPITDAQLRYLSSLVTKVSRERFDVEFTKVIKRTSIQPRQPDEKTQQVIKRLTKAAARKLISGLKQA